MFNLKCVAARPTPFTSKAGKTWWPVTVLLEDGDTMKVFSPSPIKVGDNVPFTLRPMQFSGREYLVAVVSYE